MDRLKACHRLVIGGPTQDGAVSLPMDEFIRTLFREEVRGKKAFVFDTRYADERAGSTAKIIQARVEKMGLRVVRPYASAIVLGGEGPLEKGAEEAFRESGTELAKRFL